MAIDAAMRVVEPVMMDVGLAMIGDMAALTAFIETMIKMLSAVICEVDAMIEVAASFPGTGTAMRCVDAAMMDVNATVIGIGKIAYLEAHTADATVGTGPQWLLAAQH